MYRKVLNYLRGQVTVEVESAVPERVLNLCAAHGIPFWGLTWLSEIRLRAAIDRAELPRLREVLTRTDAVLTVVRTEGAPEVWRQYRRRYVLLAAAAVLAAVNLADQLTKAQEGAENLRRQVKTYLDEASRAKSEAAELRRKLQNAQNQNNRRG